jgi:hypothetical protein
MSINRLMADLIQPSGDIKIEYLDEAPRGLDSADVEIIASQSIMTVYDSLGELPITNLIAGTEAYVRSNNRLYVSNGSGWYNVAVINLAPLATVDQGTIALDTNGVASVVKLNITDSDTPYGLLNITVESDGDFGGLATLSQDSSVFTITPLSQANATTTSSTLTFRVNDGDNLASDTTLFTLDFSSVISLTSTDEEINEGDAATFILLSNGYDDSTAVGYSITGVSSNDIDVPLTGDLLVYNDSARLTITTSEDYSTEGTETMTVSAGGYFDTVDILDTTLTRTLSVTPTASSTNEGTTITFNIAATGFDDGDPVRWEVSGDVDSADFGNVALVANEDIVSNAASVAFNISNDNTTEGSEVMTFTVTDLASGVSDSAEVTILDTSVTVTSVNDGPKNTGSWSIGSTIVGTVQNETNAYYSQLSRDGQYLVIGAWLGDINGYTANGYAQVYERNSGQGTSWSIIGTLSYATTTNARLTDVAISDGGDWVYISHPGETPTIDGSTRYGYVAAYERTGSSGSSQYTHRQNLHIGIAATSGYLGACITCTPDASYVVLGSQNHRPVVSGSSHTYGAIAVWTRSGSTHTHQQTLGTSGATVSGSWFLGGGAAEIDDNGEYIVACSTTVGSNPYVIYRRVGTTWSCLGSWGVSGSANNAIPGFEADDAQGSYGNGVAISGDGQWVAFGAAADDGPTNSNTSTGAIHIYERTAATTFTFRTTIRDAETPTRNFSLGHQVSLNYDGDRMFVAENGTNAKFMVYDRTSSTSWTLRYQTTPINNGGTIDSNSRSACCMSASGNTAIGASYDDTWQSGTQYGTTWVWMRS